MPEYKEDFWNSIASSANPSDAWALALPAVIAASGRPEGKVIAFLESRRGSAFASDVATSLNRGLPLDQAVSAAAGTLPRQMHEDWSGTLAPADPNQGRRQGRQDAVLRYRTQYLQPDQTPGFAQVWVYQLLGSSPFTLAEIGRRKPLI